MKYIKDNPKLVEDYYDFEGRETFTGVVKDTFNDIAYYLNGKYHREDGPAIEYRNGYNAWYLNGICYGCYDDFTNESWIRFVRIELLR